jgi:hypothetical protein
MLKRKRKRIPMLKGNILHDMMNALVQHKRMKDYKGKDPWEVLDEYEAKYKELFIEEQEQYGDVPGDCAKIFEGYMRMYRRDTLIYEASEEFIATDLAPGIRLIGYVDKVVRDDKGRRWLMDHKFVRTIPTADQRFHELQLLLYVWLRERWKKDESIDGVIWDYARSKAPVRPELLKKKGGLSKRKNIDTDWFTYLETINQQGLDPDDYRDMEEILEGKEETFFERVTLPKPPKRMVDQIVEDFRITAITIQKMKGIAPRSMSQFNCSGCEFKILCEAEVRGHDAAFIKKSDYEPRGEHGDEEDASAED